MPGIVGVRLCVQGARIHHERHQASPITFRYSSSDVQRRGLPPPLPADAQAPKRPRLVSRVRNHAPNALADQLGLGPTLADRQPPQAFRFVSREIHGRLSHACRVPYVRRHVKHGPSVRGGPNHVSDTGELALPLRLSGAVWGHLVGDATGVPYEFRDPKDIGEVRFGATGTYGKPPGTWSDDGALMLALLDSLTNVGFDTNDQGRRALAWWRRGAYTPDGKYFDIGRTTMKALLAIEQGTPAEQAGPTGDQSQSNGSLMRILPLALWAHAQKLGAGALVDLATRASKVTHGHPACQVVCAVYTLAAAALLRGASRRQALEASIDAVRSQYAEDGTAPDATLAAALEELVAWPTTNRPEGRGGVFNAFWSAWAAFEGASSYRETIERAIRYGNDTDTTAAIAGGLAGIRWGLDEIPAEWLAGMRGAKIVEPLGRWPDRRERLEDVDIAPDPGRLGGPHEGPGVARRPGPARDDVPARQAVLQPLERRVVAGPRTRRRTPARRARLRRVPAPRRGPRARRRREPRTCRQPSGGTGSSWSATQSSTCRSRPIPMPTASRSGR